MTPLGTGSPVDMVLLLLCCARVAGVALAPRVLPAGASSAAPMPCRARAITSLVGVWASPHPASCCSLFAVVERRVATPLLPPGTFKDRDFTTAVLVALALTASTTPAVLLSVLYQQHELHRSALETGLACMAFNLAVIGASLPANRLALAHRTAMAL